MTSRTQVWTALLAIGGLAIAAAPLLPWVSATSPELGDASRTGLDIGRGPVFVIVAGLVAVGAAILLRFDGELRRLGVQLGILAALVAGYVAWLGWQDAANPAESLLVSRDEVSVAYTAGVGLWVLLAGSVAAAAGAVGAAIATRRG
jgi:hypothetical protein